ncbi:hypothetical protein ACGTJS_11470 [Faucicola mancuniensis]|uniref:hypothetical protein n=1 Tax=Faucicola mancuniensis TaxID=1309795 RepID=UPI0028ECF1EF|nr:hypothetical protein [uncultured Moraxella sp.]
MEVTLSNDFKTKFANFLTTDKQKILDLINHITQHGFDGLTGRNKSSDEVPTAQSLTLSHQRIYPTLHQNSR